MKSKKPSAKRTKASDPSVRRERVLRRDSDEAVKDKFFAKCVKGWPSSPLHERMQSSRG